MDESGDTGFRFERNSSHYFVVTMVLMPGEEEAEELRLCIDQLKTSLRKPRMEFHFSKTEEHNRQRFFEAVQPYDFQMLALVCDKRKLLSLKDDHDAFLLSTFGAALEHARDAGLLEAANIKYDESGSSSFQKRLSSALMKKVNGADPGKYVKRIDPQGSAGNNLIQLADMLCGAVARPYNKPQRTEKKSQQATLEIIKHRGYTVLEWP